MTLGERLKHIRKSQPNKLSQEKFAASLGMSRDQYKQYELGIVVPADAVIRLICHTYYISYRWLVEEIGPMEEPPTVENLTHKYLAGESDLTKAIVQAMAGLPDEAWEQLKNWIESIRKEGL